jgi:hypothetical protein
MAEPARTFEQPHERSTGLHALGLQEAIIRVAVLRGLVARRSCTAFDPPSYPGTVQWAQTHRAMRELHVEQEWTPSDANNFSRLISPGGAVAVTVATGDEYTGRNGVLEPKTKYPKGTETKLAVEINAAQLSLWPAPGSLVAVGGSRQALWVLLIATNAEEVRYELSRPRGQDEKGRVVSWSDRIIFEPIEIESIATQGQEDPDEDEDEGTSGIDVPVERI